MPPRGRALLRSWTLAALYLLLSPAGPAATRQLDSPGIRLKPGSPKIAVFGVDAADWREIDPLVASGRLPAFARLKRVASLGVLRADPPLLSPIIWTTIATGRPPEDHGVIDFMMDLRGGAQAPVSGTARRVKAFW